MSLQKVLRVNSKYRISGTTSHFTMQFNARELDTVQSVALLDATLNRNFPNIYSPINVLEIQVTTISGGTAYLIPIPPLQYTATTLAAAMATAISGAGILGITVTYAPFPVDRFVFNWDGSGSYLFVNVISDNLISGNPASTISNSIGLMDNFFLLPNTPQSPSAPPALEGPEEVYIQSPALIGSNCADVPLLGSYIPYLGKISFAQVPYGFTGVYQSTQAELQQVNYQYRFGVQSIRTFDIQLTDRYGNELPIPANCFLDMHLAFTYSPSQT